MTKIDAENWRRSYHLQIEDAIKQYTEWRGGPRCALRVRLPGLQRSRSVHDLTDAEIESVARAEAEADVNRAIHQHHASRR